MKCWVIYVKVVIKLWYLFHNILDYSLNKLSNQSKLNKKIKKSILHDFCIAKRSVYVKHTSKRQGQKLIIA